MKWRRGEQEWPESMTESWGSTGRTGSPLQATNLDDPGDLQKQPAPFVLEPTTRLSQELDKLEVCRDLMERALGGAGQASSAACRQEASQAKGLAEQ